MEQSYLNLCNKILTQGEFRNDRTGTGTIATFAEKLEFDLSGGVFPLWTTVCV